MPCALQRASALAKVIPAPAQNMPLRPSNSTPAQSLAQAGASSIAPSQLLSRPSHDSTAGAHAGSPPSGGAGGGAPASGRAGGLVGPASRLGTSAPALPPLPAPPSFGCPLPPASELWGTSAV